MLLILIVTMTFYVFTNINTKEKINDLCQFVRADGCDQVRVASELVRIQLCFPLHTLLLFVGVHHNDDVRPPVKSAPLT